MRNASHPSIVWKPRSLDDAASANLDLIRATAAWAVMWGHLRVLFFVRFSELEHPGWFLKVLYFFTGFGHQAVVIFFVLSGFLISLSVFKAYAAGTWSWSDYAINRSVRLHVVLIPGLLFGLFWDLAGSSLFASTGLYSHPLNGLGPSIAQDNLTAGNLLGNLFFLQTILCPTFGSNGPLWSLANEFWYYALFPLAFSAAVAWIKHSIRLAIFFTLLTLCLSVLLGPEKLAGFLIWMAGCALVISYSRFRIQSTVHVIFYTLFFFLGLSVCLIAARTATWGLLGSDLALGVTFSLFLFGILQMNLGRRPAYCAGPARFLADFSYSLYVLHFPLLLFLRAWIVPPHGWQPDASRLFFGVMIGASVLSFAWLVSLLTEKNTRAAQKWIRGISRTVA